MADALDYRIAKLALAAGDILVVRVPRQLSAAQQASVLADVKKVLPSGVNAMVIEDGYDLSVLTRADIEARAG